MPDTLLTQRDYPKEHINIVFDKHQNRLFNTPLPIHIFGTGSDGNSVYLKPLHTLIDLGLPYKRYTDYDPNFFLDVNFILLTHHHSDHLNPTTLKKILTNFPHIQVMIPEFMFEYVTSKRYKPKYKPVLDANGNKMYHQKPNGEPIKNKPLYELDLSTMEPIVVATPWADYFNKQKHRFIKAQIANLTTFDNNTFTIYPLTVKHGDIVNTAYRIYFEPYDLRLLYASDLDNLNGQTTFTDVNHQTQTVTGLAQDEHYNCMFLEANYNTEMIELWESEKLAEAVHLPDAERQKAENTIQARVSGNRRHISEEEAFKYIAKHLDNNGIFVPLHASSSFSSLIQ